MPRSCPTELRQDHEALLTHTPSKARESRKTRKTYRSFLVRSIVGNIAVSVDSAAGRNFDEGRAHWSADLFCLGGAGRVDKLWDTLG